MLVVIGFICIILLVIAHEAGHFWAARKSGIEVEEFGVGFPPRAKLIKKKNGTEYTLNWLPLGGFVKLKGEHDADTEKGSFGSARLRDKVKVMLAGVGVNFFIAFALFSVIALIGMPQLIDNQFTVDSDTKIVRHDVLSSIVENGSPAEKAGMKDNDVLLAIEETGGCGNDCKSFVIQEADQLKQATEALAGKEVGISIRRGDETKLLLATLNSNEYVSQSKQDVEACLADTSIKSKEDCPQYQGYLGVVPSDFIVRRSTWSAPLVGAGVTLQFTEATLRGLWSIVAGLAQGDAGPAKDNATGVVGIGFIFSSTSYLGSIFMLMIVAVISLSLAIMNSLPIPALDGGRLFVTLLFRALHKPLTQKMEERIHGTGFAVLMILFLVITVLDVQRFIL